MLTFATSLVVAVVLTGMLVPILRRLEFVDVPNHRSSHVAPTPRGGGLAVMVAIVLGLLVARDFALWSVVFAVLAVAGVGLLDDVLSLSGDVRLLAQFLAALWVSVSLLRADEGGISWWWLPLAVVVLVGYVNAFNFMDGVNGISGLTAAVAGAFWVLVGSRQDLASLEALGLVLAGGAIGFLPWNAPRARVFLGDVGSYGLGLLIGSTSVLAWVEGVHWLVAVAPLLIYGADTGWVLMKRSRGGRPLMEAHREHVYQRLVDGGWSHVRSAALCAGVGALACSVALLTWNSMPVLGVVVLALLVSAYLGAPRLLLGQREVVQ